MKKNLAIIFGLICIGITGCGVNNNVTVNTTNGSCPNIESTFGAPYCMSVEVLNNSGGQNWITSTNYPLTDLSVSIADVGNILSPATSSSMDPNNCNGATINPGGSCTFYLKINNESYSVNSMENVNVTLSYTMNNTLFGDGSTYTTNFTVYQFTNLYIAQNDGNVWMYNASGSNYGLTESSDTINSIVTDTTYYGLLYEGGNIGIYQYGASSNTISTSISVGVSGSNNMFKNSGNLYAAGLTGATGIWSYNFTNESWSSSAVNSLSAQTNPNANALSTSAVPYIAVGTQVFSCPTTSTSTSCVTEGNVLANNVTTLGFLPGVSNPYTGLYAGTSAGLYIESSASSVGVSSSWTQVTLNNNNASISSMIASNNALFIGDSVGNIWEILSSAPSEAISFANIPGGSSSEISAMVIDNVANILYFTAGSTTAGFATYSCSIESSTSCLTPTTVISSLGNNSAIAGMAIGSSLTNDSTPLSDGI